MLELDDLNNPSHFLNPLQATQALRSTHTLLFHSRIRLLPNHLPLPGNNLLPRLPHNLLSLFIPHFIDTLLTLPCCIVAHGF